MGGLGYIRPELEPNLDRPRDRFQSDHRTFPRFRFRQSGRADLARAISHRGSDSILSQPTFPPLFPALLRTRCLRKTEGNCSSTSSSPRKGPLSVLDIPFRVAAARKGVSLFLSRFPSLRVLSSQTLHSRAPVRLHRVRCARVKDGERRREGTRVTNCTVNHAG